MPNVPSEIVINMSALVDALLFQIHVMELPEHEYCFREACR